MAKEETGEYEAFSRNIFILVHLLIIITFLGSTFLIITGTIIWLNILTAILTMQRPGGWGMYRGWPLMFGPHRVEGSDTEPTSPEPAFPA
jgi:hypothetical protein